MAMISDFKINDLTGFQSTVDYKIFAECYNNIKGNTQNNGQICGNGEGVTISVGYKMNPFVELYQVCYNPTKSAAIYSAHVLQGDSITIKMNGARDDNFRAEGLGVFTQIEIDFMYSQCNQLTVFESIFSSQQTFVVYDLMYFDRCHLAPHADFAMESWKTASNYYINVFPQWNKINRGNWRQVEDKVRDHAKKTGRTFQVFTGTHEILQLNGEEMYLYPGNPNVPNDPNRIPVPKWSWKIVKDGPADSGIAFVTLNNPYYQAPTPPTSGHFCSDICANYDWDHNVFKTPSKGYTICCNVTELMEKIPIIPSEAKVVNILRKI